MVGNFTGITVPYHRLHLSTDCLKWFLRLCDLRRVGNVSSYWVFGWSCRGCWMSGRRTVVQELWRRLTPSETSSPSISGGPHWSGRSQEAFQTRCSSSTEHWLCTINTLLLLLLLLVYVFVLFTTLHYRYSLLSLYYFYYSCSVLMIYYSSIALLVTRK